MVSIYIILSLISLFSSVTESLGSGLTGNENEICPPQQWGLSMKRDGCKPCDCDPGGAYNNDCDVISGQCQCRHHLTGRRCDTVIDFFYTGPLDYLTFEGELAHGSKDTQVRFKEPGSDTFWTGEGHMQVFEGSYLEFAIPNVIRTLEYYPVIRFAHHPNFPQTWDNATIQLKRIDGEKDPNGLCGSGMDGPIPFIMEHGMMHTELTQPFCLEEGKLYEIILKFIAYDPNMSNTFANIYIDSIALLPNIEQIPFLDPYWVGDGLDGWSPGPDEAQRNKEKLDQWSCYNIFLDAKPARKQDVPEECMELLRSISYYVFQGAYYRQCECDPTGSNSNFCDKYYGECDCKELVMGRTCNRCAPAAYGFSPSGCTRCDCHYIGAQDKFCDQFTGKCNCYEQSFGRQCDQCQHGHWGFPNCQPCDPCELCDPYNGECPI